MLEILHASLFWRFDALLIPVNGHLFHVSEIFFMIIDAVLHQIVQKVIGECELIMNVADGLHLCTCQCSAEILFCDEQKI